MKEKITKGFFFLAQRVLCTKVHLCVPHTKVQTATLLYKFEYCISVVERMYKVTVHLNSYLFTLYKRTDCAVTCTYISKLPCGTMFKSCVQVVQKNPTWRTAFVKIANVKRKKTKLGRYNMYHPLTQKNKLEKSNNKIINYIYVRMCKLFWRVYTIYMYMLL